MRALRDRLEPALLVLFVCLVVWAPVPLGSNRPWSSALLQAVLFAGLALWLLVSLRPRQTSAFEPFIQHRHALLALCAWLGVIVLQLAPIGGWTWLGDGSDFSAASLYAQAPRAGTSGASPRAPPITVDLGTTLLALVKYGAYVAALMLTLALTRTRARHVLVAGAVVAACTLQSIYGIAVYVAGDALQWWDPRFSREGVAGTYVNQNHFAGLVVLGVGLALGLLSAVPAPPRRPGARGLLVDAIAWLQGPSSVLVFALLCMTGAVVLSASRGALGALLVMSVAGSVLMRWHGGGPSGRRKSRGWSPALVLALLVLVGGVWFGGQDLVRKLDAQGLGSNRAELAASTIELALHNPWLGSGAGTFRWQFPAIRKPELGSSYYQHAHNDWLEMFVDVGIVGTACLTIGLALIGWRLIAALRQRHDRLARGMLGGSAMASGAFVLHAMVDFNFNIPANAVMFFIVLGLGMNAASRQTFAAARAAPYREPVANPLSRPADAHDTVR